jgi:alpha-mannosidase
VVVFNPLSWTRTDVVALPLADIPLYPESFRMVDEGGRPVPVQQTGEELLFLAAEVPGLGYRTFWIDKGTPAAPEPEDAASADGSSLANGELAAVLDVYTGRIRTLTHRPTGRSVLAEGGGNVLQVFGDIPRDYDAWNIGYTGEEWTVETTPSAEVLERGPLRARVRVTRTWGGSSFVQDYVVTAGSPLLEVRTTADWNESHKLLKAAFFLDTDATEAVYEIPYGTIARTTRPQTAAEKAKWEVPGQRWVDVSRPDGSFGVTLVNDSKYGYDVVGDRLRLTLLRAPKSPDPQADIGRHTFAYALYPHQGDWKAADSWKRGAEYNLPLQARLVDRHRGELPSSGALISLEQGGGDARRPADRAEEAGGDHVALTALKCTRVPTRMPRWVVRLSEIEGREGEVTLRFPFRIARAWEANLMEDPGMELRPDRDTLTVTVAARGLKTLLVEPVMPGGR